MKKINSSREDFLKALSKGKRCYIRKDKSWQKIWLWWENSSTDINEFWFMNIANEARKNGKIILNESSWVIAKDLDDRLNYYERNGYKYYIEE